MVIVTIVTIVIICLILCAVAYSVGYTKGKKQKELDGDPYIAILSLKRRVEDTGIHKFGRNNPNQTDYEKGYLECLNHFDSVIEAELAAIKESGT